MALCIVMALGILAGCGQKGNDTPKNDNNSTALSGSVSTNGSTSMDKVIGALKEQFTADNPGVTVTYDPTGSGAGIEAVKNGSADIGLASRALKDQEKSAGLQETTVALDGIAIIVNAGSKVADLTVQQIADIFTETALQEKEHAKRLFKFLEGGDVEITAAFPAGIITGTEANLYAAAAGEHHEYTEMYPSFANIADSEGFSEIACVMRNIAIAEQYHEERFLAFAKNIKEGRVFVRETPVVWRCRNCGCLVTGTHAPALCPACAHPTAHFEVLHNPW